MNRSKVLFGVATVVVFTVLGIGSSPRSKTNSESDSDSEREPWVEASDVEAISKIWKDPAAECPDAHISQTFITRECEVAEMTVSHMVLKKNSEARAMEFSRGLDGKGVRSGECTSARYAERTRKAGSRGLDGVMEFHEILSGPMKGTVLRISNDRSRTSCQVFIMTREYVRERDISVPSSLR